MCSCPIYLSIALVFIGVFYLPAILMFLYEGIRAIVLFIKRIEYEESNLTNYLNKDSDGSWFGVMLALPLFLGLLWQLGIVVLIIAAIMYGGRYIYEIRSKE